MNIEKALEHFEWKLKNHWKPTPKDVEAYNTIVLYKKINEEKIVSDNKALAKLWIHQLILLSKTKMYSGERSIQVIDEILNKSVYEWCMILKSELPMMRFNNVGHDKYPLDEKDSLNITKIDERNSKIIEEFETELTSALKYEISEENIIKFVNLQISRIINIFD